MAAPSFVFRVKNSRYYENTRELHPEEVRIFRI